MYSHMCIHAHMRTCDLYKSLLFTDSPMATNLENLTKVGSGRAA